MRRLLYLLGVLIASCDANYVFYNPTPQGIVARGKALFETRGLGGVPYSCKDCHPTTPEDPEAPLLTPAHTLYNVASRSSWYGGKLKTRAVQGAQACLVDRMQGKPLEGDDVEAMQAYLGSISPARRTPALHEAKPPKVAPAYLSEEEISEAKLALGVEEGTPEDVTRGYLLYQRACLRCHIEGQGLGPPLRGLSQTPGDFVSLVRSGKGNMPPFGPDRISDQDLYAIAAYLTWISPGP